jgi:methylated-DNA-[protein]-cysteine S-methyltransferase
MAFTTYESPLGALTLAGADGKLCRLAFPGAAPALPATERDDAAFAEVTGQLDAWFAGETRAFDVPLELGGTPFQRLVWDAVARIPYGTTTAYGALARELGALRAGGVPEVRAVAAAVGATPVPIIVPCHRVVAANGALTGYGGGLERKAALLAFEASGGRRLVPRPDWGGRQLALC